MTTSFNYSDFSPSDIISDKTIERIRSFSTLPYGWDYGDGHPIIDKVITNAIFIYKIGKYYQFDSNALPDSDGSIILNLFIEDNFLLITLKENLTFDLTYEKGKGLNYKIIRDEHNVSIEKIENTLKEIYEKWFLLELYTLKSTIRQGEDSEAMFSKIPVGWIPEEYPFLKKNVLNQKVHPSAPISSNFIIQQSVTQYYTQR